MNRHHIDEAVRKTLELAVDPSGDFSTLEEESQIRRVSRRPVTERRIVPLRRRKLLLVATLAALSLAGVAVAAGDDLIGMFDRDTAVEQVDTFDTANAPRPSDEMVQMIAMVDDKSVKAERVDGALLRGQARQVFDDQVEQVHVEIAAAPTTDGGVCTFAYFDRRSFTLDCTSKLTRDDPFDMSALQGDGVRLAWGVVARSISRVTVNGVEAKINDGVFVAPVTGDGAIKVEATDASGEIMRDEIPK